MDDKIILGWNALMNTACSKAFEATGKEEYRQLAIDNMQFLLKYFHDERAMNFIIHGKTMMQNILLFLTIMLFLIQALIQIV